MILPRETKIRNAVSSFAKKLGIEIQCNREEFQEITDEKTNTSTSHIHPSLEKSGWQTTGSSEPWIQIVKLIQTSFETPNPWLWGGF